MSRSSFLIGSLIYALLIVYGSLVPLDYQPIPFDETLERFRNIAYLDLGIASRADWVANILLYVPLGFLMMASVALKTRMLPVLAIGATLTMALGMALAVAVEFTQHWFPPRTVSLNDLIAETLGTAIGIATWVLGRSRLVELWQRLRSGGMTAARASLAAFVFAYLALSLFPFDFLVSLDELNEKLALGNQGVLWAENGCNQWARCLALTIAEMLVVMPLGLLLAMSKRDGESHLSLAVALGFALGAFIEFMQFFQASGIAQGISVVTRTAGVVLGYQAVRLLQPGVLAPLRPWIKPLILLMLPLYFAGVALLSGLFNGQLIGPIDALRKVAEIPLLPFYYHYWSTELQAVASVLAQLGLYGPIGMMLWAWRASSQKLYQTSGGAYAAKLAFGLALLVEAAKLFIAAKHPDPTNLLLAAAFAAVMYKALAWFQRMLNGGEGAVATAAAPMPIAEEPAEKQQGFTPAGLSVTSIAAPLAVGLAVALAMSFPWGAMPLAVGLLIYAVVLWRYPWLWLVAVPALLPVLDLAPWTGRFFLDEFDLLLLVTLGVGLARMPDPGQRWFIHRRMLVAVGSVALMTVWGAVYGMMVADGASANFLSSQFSPLNGLRLAKGVLWALLLMPLLHRSLVYPNVWQWLGLGMALGLIFTAVAVMLERAAFVGLFNFDADFRVTATFSSMNTGGGAIGTYLAAAIPLLWWLRRSGPLFKLLAVAAFVLALYALLVTYARAAWLGVGVAALIIFLGGWRLQRDGGRALRYVLPVLLLAIIGGGWLVGSDGFMGERFSTSNRDIGVRGNHWADTLNTMDRDIVTAMVGMGSGRFPEIWHRRTDRQNLISAEFRYVDEGDNRFLRLATGRPVYVVQDLGEPKGGEYTLQARVRANAGQSIGVPICERSLLYSKNCTGARLTSKVDGTWQTLSAPVDMSKLTADRSWPAPPLVLALSNPNRQGVVDVDDIRLLDADGNNVLDNGNFQSGSDRWFFTADEHLSWHAKNFWVSTFFEQGALGVGAMALLSIIVLMTLLRGGGLLDVGGLPLLGSFMAFMTAGMFVSFMDFPRIGFLFHFLSLTALMAAGLREVAERVMPTAKQAEPEAEPENTPPPKRDEDMFGRRDGRDARSRQEAAAAVARQQQWESVPDHEAAQFPEERRILRSQQRRAQAETAAPQDTTEQRPSSSTQETQQPSQERSRRRRSRSAEDPERIAEAMRRSRRSDHGEHE